MLQRLFKRYDKNEDEQIDFKEFVRYIQDHEKELRLYFKKLDVNNDGTINLLCCYIFFLLYLL